MTGGGTCCEIFLGSVSVRVVPVRLGARCRRWDTGCFAHVIAAPWCVGRCRCKHAYSEACSVAPSRTFAISRTQWPQPAGVMAGAMAIYDGLGSRARQQFGRARTAQGRDSSYAMRSRQGMRLSSARIASYISAASKGVRCSSSHTTAWIVIAAGLRLRLRWCR